MGDYSPLSPSDAGPTSDDPLQVLLIAAKVLSVVGAPYYLAETMPPAGITVSVGISIYPTDGTDASALIRRADLAMYEVKRSGGNAFAFAHADMPTWTVPG